MEFPAEAYSIRGLKIDFFMRRRRIIDRLHDFGSADRITDVVSIAFPAADAFGKGRSAEHVGAEDHVAHLRIFSAHGFGQNIKILRAACISAGFIP